MVSRNNILIVYLKKDVFTTIERAEHYIKKQGYKTMYRNKRGYLSDDYFVFKQKDSGRYPNNRQELGCQSDVIRFKIGFKK
jgi:hypothetical protein